MASQSVRSRKNTIQNKAMVGRPPPVGGTHRKDEPFEEPPLLFRHQVSCQAGLHRRYQLESRSTETVNPFCQHGLSSVELTPETVASYDAILLLTDHSAFDYEMIREHAQLLIDTRGKYHTAVAPNVVAA